MATRFSQGDSVIVKENGDESTYPIPPVEARGKIGLVEFCVGASQGMRGDQMYYGELFTGLGNQLYQVGIGDKAYVMHGSWLMGVVKTQ